MITPQVRPWKIPWHLILIFWALSLGFLTIGYFYNNYQLSYIKREKQGELHAIAELKVNQIVAWRQERLADATVILEDRFLADKVNDWLKGPTVPDLEEDILNRLTDFKFYQYQSISLLDPQGRVRLSVPDPHQKIGPYAETLAREAMQTQRVVFSDLYSDEVAKTVRLSLLVPLCVKRSGSKVLIGLILLEIDPHQFLYPLIQSWPTPSRSAENELLRREGNTVVFLNELRHQKHRPLTLSFPLSKPNEAAALAVQQEEGIIEGIDYRRVPVLAAVARIPDSPWFLTAKVDQVEIYAPLRERFIMVAVLVLIVIVGAGISTGVIIVKQKRAEDEIRVYQERLRSLAAEMSLVEERERHHLATELHENIGQILATAKMKLGGLLNCASTADLTSGLAEIRNYIDQSIHYTRSLTNQLSLPILYELGFEEAIEWLAMELGNLSGVKVVVETKQLPTPLTEEARILLYHALKELLNNMAEHAQAHHARVLIDRDGDNLRFQVEDDGIGFDFAKAGGAGFGLFGIRERLDKIGGRLEIASNPGVGTRATLIVPCTPKAKDSQRSNPSTSL